MTLHTQQSTPLEICLKNLLTQLKETSLIWLLSGFWLFSVNQQSGKA